MKKTPRAIESHAAGPGHPDTEHPLRFPKKASTKSALSAGMSRAGNPNYPDYPVGSDGNYKSSDKLHGQSAGAQRWGDNRYANYPDASVSNDSESTGKSGAGSTKGTRGSIHE
jgi:hypothetical protein